MTDDRIGVAIIGSGNIGTDLLFKIKRLSPILEVLAMVGVDPNSDGLARAARLGTATTSDGVAGLLELPEFEAIKIVFDATSAGAHRANAEALQPFDKIMIDLTPAAIGPYVVPPVNGDKHLGLANVNMVTCGGQATVPMVAAVSSVTTVHYAEIVASISSRSAGPGTRANIDEFTETTRDALVSVGGARLGKAIIVLNPATPPVLMRDTVLCLTGPLDSESERAIEESVKNMVERVARYVPGYRLKQPVQFHTMADDEPVDGVIPGVTGPIVRVAIYLEVEGAGHYLPAYAGNLDIMTSAAVQVAERMAQRLVSSERSLA